MVPVDGPYTDAALDDVLERFGGELCCPTDEVERFGSVNTRDNGCCRIRSRPDGPRPSGSSKGDLCRPSVRFGVIARREEGPLRAKEIAYRLSWS